MKEWFEDWFDSPYYHLLYKNRTNDEANLFVTNCVQHFKLEKDTLLLDVACGKGRHSVAFTNFGVDVVGVDLSKQSIEFASQFESEKLHFYVHDMRKVFRVNYFDIVCNLFTSFGYFKTIHDNFLAAKSMSLGLKKGGVLIIDFVNQRHARKNIINNQHEIINRENVQFEINRSFTDHKLTKDIHITDNTIQSHFQESVNSFSEDEMKAIFKEVGLTYKKTFGDYHFGNYDKENSARMILVFEK